MENSMESLYTDHRAKRVNEITVGGGMVNL